MGERKDRDWKKALPFILLGGAFLLLWLGKKREEEAAKAEVPPEELPPPTVPAEQVPPETPEAPVEYPTPEAIPKVDEWEAGRLLPEAVEMSEPLLDCLAEKLADKLVRKEAVKMYSNDHYRKAPYYEKYYYARYDAGHKSIAHVQGYLMYEPTFRIAKDADEVARICEGLTQDAIRTDCSLAMERKRMYETPEGMEQVKIMVRDYQARLSAKAQEKYYEAYHGYWWGAYLILPARVVE